MGMVSEWWLVVMSFLWLVALVWVQRLAYRHGIWDGAFNHFLPVVRREMLFYDRHRAEAIFRSEGHWPKDDSCNEKVGRIPIEVGKIIPPRTKC